MHCPPPAAGPQGEPVQPGRFLNTKSSRTPRPFQAQDRLQRHLLGHRPGQHLQRAPGAYQLLPGRCFDGVKETRIKPSVVQQASPSHQARSYIHLCTARRWQTRRCSSSSRRARHKPHRGLQPTTSAVTTCRTSPSPPASPQRVQVGRWYCLALPMVTNQLGLLNCPGCRLWVRHPNRCLLHSRSKHHVSTRCMSQRCCVLFCSKHMHLPPTFRSPSAIRQYKPPAHLHAHIQA